MSLLLAAVLLVACGDDDSTVPDAGARTDGGGPRDSGPPADGAPIHDGGQEVDGGRASCGGARPDIDGVEGTEGLVIARDGTIYYAQMGAIGRVTADGRQEDGLVSPGGVGRTLWGLALDAVNETLFVGVPGVGVFSVDLTVPTLSAEPLVTGGGPNGLTMGPDGRLYYSDFPTGVVYSVDPAGGDPVEVTARAIPNANGVAFEAGGTLLVASYAQGVLYRLTLDGGVESNREMVASDLGSPDGVAVDAEGTIYVTDNAGGTLSRLDADGTPTPLETGMTAPANIEFGAGALDCEDIYVANYGPLRRHEDGTVAGAPVPWH